MAPERRQKAAEIINLPHGDVFNRIDAVDVAFGDLSAAIDALDPVNDSYRRDDDDVQNVRDYLSNMIRRHRDTVRRRLEEAFENLPRGPSAGRT
jgi:hypothetical protein